MNFQLLSQVVKELSTLLAGSRVERVYQGDKGGIYIILRHRRKNSILLLSPGRALPRMHLVTGKPRSADAVHPFVLQLRSRLPGAGIEQVSLVNQDRVVEFCFTRQAGQYRLYFELLGSAANLVFTDASLKILAIFHAVPLADGARVLAPGATYSVPRKKPFMLSGAAREDERSGQGESDDARGANRNAELFYERLIAQRATESLRAELASLVKKILARAERRIAALTADEKAAGQAEEYRQAGDLILANLNRLETGMEQAELTGYDGKSVLVSLDPKRSPARNAEWYFKKYKKAKAGKDIIAKRLRLSLDEASWLRACLSEIKLAVDGEALTQLREALIAEGYLPVEGSRKGKARAQPAPAPFRKILYCGWDILVGRSAAGNDYLTTKVARGRDLWLHAEDMPGSHVLIRNPENRDIPPDVLAKAASLAAFYSKGRASGKVAVTYAPAQSVKKPKGAKPGLVRLSTRKTIMAAPEAG